MNADTEAIPEDWIERYHYPVYKYCYHMLRHRQEAEDAVQEVFLVAYKQVSSAAMVHTLSSWLYRIAHNHCLNVVKRKRMLRFIPFLSEGWGRGSEEPGYKGVESNLDIDALLAVLSPADRSIVILRLVEDRPYEEIGVIVNASPAAVRKRFERAKSKLKRTIVKQEGGAVHESSETVTIL